MANIKHLEQLAKGSSQWNAWREEHPEIHPDLSNATINDPLPHWAIQNPVQTELKGINFSRTNLRHCLLRGADLVDANLKSADLKDADLRKAQLVRADLTGASLHQTNLTLANLRDANLTNALLWETILARTDLKDVKGLASCRHGGPSVVDHRTFRRSGDVPRTFWRGCGIPEELINHLQELSMRQARMPSCFISYSTTDSEFASKLYQNLQDYGVDCWMAEYKLEGGRYLIDQIDEAIEEHDRVLIILSSRSIGRSWVLTEIQKARRREIKEGRQLLFPVRIMEFSELQSWVCFDSDSGEDVAIAVRKYFIPDFSNWRDEAHYKEAFEKLVRALARNKQRNKA